jgi:hypothetical protein
MLSVLESAEAAIEFKEHANWKGGQYYYSLQLRVPCEQFAQLEPRIESLQKALQVELSTVFKGTEPHFLTSATIIPFTKRAGGPRRNMEATDAIERVWGEDGFRLFLSHVAKHKKCVAELKDTLAIYGVRAFVAHTPFQPTQEWVFEIETALNTMHGMAAILTPEFKHSEWTEQEVGYALGRGIKIVTVKAGGQPHGLLARQQALAADFAKIPLLAKEIVSFLLKEPITQPRMCEALAESLASSSCWANTELIVAQLESIGTVTSNNAERISVAQI